MINDAAESPPRLTNASGNYKQFFTLYLEHSAYLRGFSYVVRKWASSFFSWDFWKGCGPELPPESSMPVWGVGTPRRWESWGRHKNILVKVNCELVSPFPQRAGWCPPLRNEGTGSSQSCICSFFQGELMPPEGPSRRLGQCYCAVGQRMQASLPGLPSRLCSSQVGGLPWDAPRTVEITILSCVQPLALLLLLPSISSPLSLMLHLCYLFCLQPLRFCLFAFMMAQNINAWSYSRITV